MHGVKENQNEDDDEVPYRSKNGWPKFLSPFRHLGPTKMWAFSKILYRSKICI